MSDIRSKTVNFDAGSILEQTADDAMARRPLKQVINSDGLIEPPSFTKPLLQFDAMVMMENSHQTSSST